MAPGGSAKMRSRVSVPCLLAGNKRKAPHLYPSFNMASDDQLETTEVEPTESNGRRRFLRETAAGAIGACCVLAPGIAGLVAWLDPLTQESGSADAVKVGTLESLPVGGVPRRVTVVMGRNDAWTREDSVPVGAIYLRRTADRTVQALHSVCPHAGCFVDYQAGRGMFLCPCHDSTFAVDGTINDPRSPSPRGMDTLEVELRGSDVWVHFRNFRTGIREKVPVV